MDHENINVLVLMMYNLLIHIIKIIYDIKDY